MNMETKECKSCNQHKPLSEMVKSKQYIDGYFCYCKACMRIKSLEQRKKFPLQRMLDNTNSSAKKRGIEFSLKLKDLIVPEFCPYLGIKITMEVGKGLLPSAAAIDRIDNKKGYTKDNIQIISFKANRLKSELTTDELYLFANNLIKLYQKPNF